MTIIIGFEKEQKVLLHVFQDPCFNSWIEATKAVNTRELFGRALGLEMTNILRQLPETKRCNLVHNSNLLLLLLAELI